MVDGVMEEAKEGESVESTEITDTQLEEFNLAVEQTKIASPKPVTQIEE